MNNITFRKLSSLKESPSNPRKIYDQAALEDLAASIKEHGVMQPILVRQMKNLSLEIIVGHRRWRASQLAGACHIPCVVVSEDDYDDAKVLEIQLVENDQREGVEPLEEADAIDALITTHGRAPEDVAAKLGRPIEYVRRRRLLTALIPELRALLEQKLIGLGSGEQLGKLPQEMQQELAPKLSKTRVGNGGERRAWMSYEVNNAIMRTTRRLKTAVWGMDEELEGLPTCSGCAMRSSNQISLPSVGADEDDRCLSPKCWLAKLEVKIGARIDAIVEGGEGKVKRWNEKKEKERSSDRSAFYNALQICYHDEQRRTYEELLPESVPKHVEVWEGYGGGLESAYFYSKSDVHSNLKRDHPGIYYALVGEPDPEKAARREESLAASRAHARHLIEWTKAQPPTKPLLCLLTRAMILDKGNWGAEKACGAHGVEPPTDDLVAHYTARAKEATVSELLELMAFYILKPALHSSSRQEEIVALWEEASGIRLGEPANDDKEGAA